MPSLFRITLITTSLLFISGCNQESNIESHVENTSNQVQLDADPQPSFFPETRQQQQAYALGATFAASLVQNLENPRELGINLEDDYVLQGINDVFSGNRLIPAAASSELLEALQNDFTQAMARNEELAQ